MQSAIALLDAETRDGADAQSIPGLSSVDWHAVAAAVPDDPSQKKRLMKHTAQALVLQAELKKQGAVEVRRSLVACCVSAQATVPH